MARRPRLLDLFCGAGGASRGYHNVGFDVTGVDIEPQPRYPFEFIQADALDVLAEVGGGAEWFPSPSGIADMPRLLSMRFDAVHASPPCPRYSLVSGFHGVAEDHPDLIAPTREALDAISLPYVIENVPGAPLRRDVVLCGEMFGLRVHRHRLFETRGFFVMQPPHARHSLRGGRTNCETGLGVARWITGNYADHDDASDAMGVDWMSRRELANAIPPAYTEHIGEYLMAEIRCAPGATT